MKQPIKKNNFLYFARSRLRLRPQEIWERDYDFFFCNFENTLLLLFSLTTFRTPFLNLRPGLFWERGVGCGEEEGKRERGKIT